MWLEFVKTLLVLLGVLGLIVVLAYAVRKYAPSAWRGDGGAEGWRILGMKILGPKRQVYLIEVGTRLLVVGVTDRTMTTLSEIADPKERDLVLAATERSHGTRFRDFLRKAES